MTDYTAQINALFQDIQFQDGSPIEIAAYNAGLNSGALTLASLAALITQDAYTLEVVDPVIREYQAAFGRVPDQSGLAYWVNEVGANPSALATLNTTFANSAEFNARYDASATTRPTLGLVAALYENVLGRQPDSAGLAYWVNSGLDAAQLLQAFSQSAEFINNTAASVTTYEYLEAAGAPPTAGSLLNLGPAGGQYFTLTAGVDTLSLTANNNTINGTFGALNATLTAGDSINGGQTAGNTLNLVDLGIGGVGNPTTVGANSISDIQTINVVSSETINANTASSSAGFSGLTQLNVTESSNGASSTITAAATTNINIIDQSQTNGGVVSAQGGLDISVAVAEVASVSGGSIIVGSLTAPAVGTVSIIAAAQPFAAANLQMGAITVYGGTNDSITEVEAGSPGFWTTGGAVSVYGGAATTSVTVDQTAPAAPSFGTAGVVDGAVLIKDVNEPTGSAGVITTVSLDGLNGANNIYDNALTSLTVNDALAGTSVAIVEGPAAQPTTILGLWINNDPGLILNDFNNQYATINVTLGAGAYILTLNDLALKTLTLFGPSGGSVLLTSDAATPTTINASADTGAVTLTNSGASATTVYGGMIDTITQTETSAPGGAVAVYGGAVTTSVTVDQTAPAAGVVDGAVTIRDVNEPNGSAGVITTVSLDGLNGANNIYDNALASLTVNDAAVGTSVNITEGPAAWPATTLALSLGNDPGLTLNDIGNKYTTVNVTLGVGAYNLTLNDTALATLTLSGLAGSIALASNAAALTTIDASAYAGAVSFTDSWAGATVKGGSGNDVLTLTAALTGGSINLGGGNNSLLAAPNVGSIGPGVSVDGGTGGVNTISAVLINPGNAANIKDFQILDVSGFGGSLDASLLPTPVTGVSISTGSTNGPATLLNLAAAVTVTDTHPSDNSALTLTHAGSATDSLAINFAGATATTQEISTLTSTGDTTIAINSGGASTTNIIGVLNETDNHLTTITITGAQAFELLGVSTDGAQTSSTPSSLATIDGHAATGALDIVAGATTASNVSYAGLKILGGVGGDAITNGAANGVITEGATAAALHNVLSVTGSGAVINDQASAGTDTINLFGVNETANLGGGGTAAASTTVSVTNTGVAATVLDTVNFGSGIATVTDNLAYQAIASASSANTDGNLLALGGALHGEILAFSSAVANPASALGAAANVSAAANLDQAVFLAESPAANTVTWFQYKGATYIEDSGLTPTSTAGAEVVQITGMVDLSHTTISGGGAHLTFA
jgi:S-layer protein